MTSTATAHLGYNAGRRLPRPPGLGIGRTARRRLQRDRALGRFRALAELYEAACNKEEYDNRKQEEHDDQVPEHRTIAKVGPGNDMHMQDMGNYCSNHIIDYEDNDDQAPEQHAIAKVGSHCDDGMQDMGTYCSNQCINYKVESVPMDEVAEFLEEHEDMHPLEMVIDAIWMLGARARPPELYDLLAPLGLDVDQTECVIDEAVAMALLLREEGDYIVYNDAISYSKGLG